MPDSEAFALTDIVRVSVKKINFKGNTTGAKFWKVEGYSPRDLKVLGNL